jgi:hypothetical protein
VDKNGRFGLSSWPLGVSWLVNDGWNGIEQFPELDGDKRETGVVSGSS